MQLNLNLAQEFADVVLYGVKGAVREVRENIPKTYYGTVESKSGSQAMVRLDGAAEGTLTPCALANDAKAGDRVAVQIKNRKAVITGNITSPANATVGDFYMELTEEGLNIGQKNGYYISIGDNDFRFCDSGGATLATLSLSNTNYGNAMLLLASLLGLRSTYGNDRAEVITMATNGSNAAAVMQVRSGSQVLSSVVADKTGAYADGFKILNVDNLLLTGSAGSTITIPANKSVVFTANAVLPTGFMLIGLSSVSVTKTNGARNRNLKVTRFTTTRAGAINVTVLNDSTSSMAASVSAEWFALRCDRAGNGTSTNINIEIDDE